MRFRHFFRAIGLGTMTLAASHALSQPIPGTSFLQRDEESILQSLLIVNSASAFGSLPRLEVQGERVIDLGIISASQLILSPGSRLVISGSISAPSGFAAFIGKLFDPSARYLIAPYVRVEPGFPPPVITWEREAGDSRPPPGSGKGQAGVGGRWDGPDGMQGSDGIRGNPGFPGRSAPTLFFITQQFEGGTLRFDLRGQDGGPGGEGQGGGDGGPGRPALPGTVDVFRSCLRSGTDGGNGGKGGTGGVGGPGGRGGDGGVLVVVADGAALPYILSNIELDPGGGTGGPGGPGGQPGDGGPGGAGFGNAQCGGGRMGGAGPKGAAGAQTTARAEAGAKGRGYAVPLKASNSTILKSQPR